MKKLITLAAMLLAVTPFTAERANGSICGNENTREKESIRAIDADRERETAAEIGYDHSATRIHR
jgi:hypothetical protein